MQTALEFSMVGMFFHGTVDGKISTQGVVKAAGDGHVMLQYHSWVDGEKTHCKLFELDDLVGDCLFYDSPDDWKSAGDKMTVAASLSPESPYERNESPADGTNSGGGD